MSEDAEHVEKEASYRRGARILVDLRLLRGEALEGLTVCVQVKEGVGVEEGVPVRVASRRSIHVRVTPRPWDEAQGPVTPQIYRELQEIVGWASPVLGPLQLLQAYGHPDEIADARRRVREGYRMVTEASRSVRTEPPIARSRVLAHLRRLRLAQRSACRALAALESEGFGYDSVNGHAQAPTAGRPIRFYGELVGRLASTLGPLNPKEKHLRRAIAQTIEPYFPPLWTDARSRGRLDRAMYRSG